jgi:hypothetical protein
MDLQETSGWDAHDIMDMLVVPYSCQVLETDVSTHDSELLAAAAARPALHLRHDKDST